MMGRLKSKSGEVLYKKIKLKIFYPGNQKHVVKELRAPAGRGITESAIADWLKSFADGIEKAWPEHEYRLVELAPNSFNFVWQDYKVKEAASA
jgi:hypothetical protein